MPILLGIPPFTTDQSRRNRILRNNLRHVVGSVNWAFAAALLYMIMGVGVIGYGIWTVLRLGVAFFAEVGR